MTIDGAPGNTIGGTAAGARNVLSGNVHNGVEIKNSGASGNVVLGNFIGTDVTGTIALANYAGVEIDGGASGNLIGTNGDGVNDAAERNIISGNLFAGVWISGAGTNSNVVAGNYIGTDISGTSAVGNGSTFVVGGDDDINGGVLIENGASDNLIGTSGRHGSNDADDRNVISGNDYTAVILSGTGTSGNVVAGNYLGTTMSGEAALPNGMYGDGVDIVNGASGNWIGVNAIYGLEDADQGNLISGNDATYSWGVWIDPTSSDNVIAGNLIGVDAAGSESLGNDNGVYMQGPANLVGTNGDGVDDAIERNVISGNTGQGIEVVGTTATGNVIAGNYIGTDATGTVALGNSIAGIGLDSGANRNTIGGSTAAARNLISGNHTRGVSFSNAATTANLVAGNWIGLSSDGAPLGNGPSDGVTIGNAVGNTIGGLTATPGTGLGNVISSSGYSGVYVYQAASNVILGNLIGTDATGMSSSGYGNGGDGVTLDNSPNNTIGGTASGARNVISGSTFQGIAIFGSGATGNLVVGNWIGTNQDGSGALPNGDDGILIGNVATANTISGNLISGNTLAGIDITDSGTENNLVIGNDIGTTADGMASLGNLQQGVLIQGAAGNTIGGTGSGMGNVISGNLGQGVMISGTGASNNVVQGNFIGTDESGTTALANGGDGVAIASAQDNIVSGNLISGNSGNGVSIGAEQYGGGLPISFIDSANPGMLGLGTVTTGADLSAHMFTAYSNTTLFVAFWVRDDFIDAQPQDASNPDLNDSIELFIDGDRVANDYTSFGPGSREGFQIIAGPLGDKLTVATDFTNNDWSVTTNYLPGGYFMEFALPLGLIDTQDGAGYTPAGPGSLLRFQAAITDNDRLTSTQDTYGILWRVGSQFPARDGEVAWVTDLYLDNGTPPVSTAPLLIDAPFRASGLTASDEMGSGASGNIVQGNRIGTTADGTAALANGQDGVLIDAGASSNLIGTNGDGIGDAAERNIISGNAWDGVHIQDTGTTGNVVAGNFIGTDASGTAALGNGSNGVGDGVMVAGGAQANIIGTNGDGVADGAERNIISGNAGPAIEITDSGTDNNVVAGNYIGTDVTGSIALTPGQPQGVYIHGGASSNRVGTNGDGIADAAERNVIAGSLFNGVAILNVGTQYNVVAGNYIGTDATGTVPLGNGNAGVTIQLGATNNRIGTDANGIADAAERNVIAASSLAGVSLGLADDNTVAGNYIGTDATGTVALGNTGPGIDLNSSFCTIGGTTDAARNVIAGNIQDGIRVRRGSNLVQGNYIGTDITGTVALPNGGDGVRISNNAQNNVIGGEMAGQANTIAYNGGNGVTVVGDLSAGNAILGNSIDANSKLGIDLGDDGVTLNDSSGHAGPNLFQDFPVLSAAEASESGTVITGALSGAPDTSYTVELFGNAAADPSGYGQGQTFLTSAVVTTDDSGQSSFAISLPVPLPIGQSVTATATDPAGNTSEFSADVTVTSLLAPASVYVATEYAGDAPGTAVTWSDGSTHYVGFDAFGTIQDGINAVAAGGTVNVASGTYTEQLTIDHSLSLLGAGASSTTIHAPAGLNSDEIAIASGVAVAMSGLKVDGASTSTAIEVNGGDLSASSLAITGYNVGISVENGGTATVFDSTIGGSTTGILVGSDSSDTSTLTATNDSFAGDTVGVQTISRAGCSTPRRTGGAAAPARPVPATPAAPARRWSATSASAPGWVTRTSSHPTTSFISPRAETHSL